jgi:hypothetical protein
MKEKKEKKKKEGQRGGQGTPWLARSIEAARVAPGALLSLAGGAARPWAGSQDRLLAGGARPRWAFCLMGQG